MENEIIETVEVLPSNVIEAQSRAEIDIQVATAKNYPRNVKRSLENVVAIVTGDADLASVCHYSLPRAGKDIKGPSVHLARIMASEYKNLRVDSKIVSIEEKMLTAQSVCIDLENNYAVRTEVKRRITDKRGQRFNDDMIVVTANAAMAIAQRNAIFQVIPRMYVDKAYNAVKHTLVGNISDEEKLLQRRKNILDGFRDEFGVKPEEITKMLGIGSIGEIKKDEILTLVGLANAIHDGDTTVEEAFGRQTSQVAKETQAKVKEALEFAEKKKAEKEEAAQKKKGGKVKLTDEEIDQELQKESEKNGSGNKK